MRNALFDHINALGFEELDRLGTSSLITRVTNDVNQLQVAVAMLIRLAIRAPFLAIGAIVMAMLLDLKPVSYTHLDVYKRQPRARGGRRGRHPLH